MALRTGDVAVVDEQGFARIVDRKKDMILVSVSTSIPMRSRMLSPCTPACSRSARSACPTPGLARRSRSSSSSDPNLTEEALLAHCRKNLTGYKMPKIVEFRKELPKPMSARSSGANCVADLSIGPIAGGQTGRPVRFRNANKISGILGLLKICRKNRDARLTVNPARPIPRSSTAALGGIAARVGFSRAFLSVYDLACWLGVWVRGVVARAAAALFDN